MTSAYYSEADRCWWVPVSSELWQEADEAKLQPIEPCRVELRDGELLITPLEREPPTWTDPLTGLRMSAPIL